MKKFTIAIIIAALVCLALTACENTANPTRIRGNRAVGGQDVQTMHYAYIKLDGQTIAEGHVTQWRDYDQSDVVQVMIDGKYYLTHYSNVILVADPSMGGVGYDSGWVDYN